MNKELCLNTVHVAHLSHYVFVKAQMPRETNLNKEVQHWSPTFGYFFLCIHSHACVLHKKRDGENKQQNRFVEHMQKYVLFACF